jgi:hypothetical protein
MILSKTPYKIVPYIVRILDPNWAVAFALAAAITHQFLSPLRAIEA